ncbi:MAG: hypothetical protein ACJ8LN_02685 [Sulfurifustis sp.]
MLRSSIKRIERWATASAQSFGIAMSRTEFTVARLALNGTTPKIALTRSLPAPPGWFDGTPAASHAALARDVLTQLAPEACATFAPVHLALPDPLGVLAMFDLDELPKTDAARRQLVRWRIAKELGLTDADIDVVYQDHGADNGKRLLLGQAMHAGWLGVIKKALRDARITPWSINHAICFRFNRHYQRLAADGAPGAWLVVDADAWTCALWDTATRLRFVRSRWRGKNEPSAANAIAEEFERAVLAYVYGNSGRAVERVYVTAAAAERDAIVAALNHRLSAPCIPLIASEVAEDGAAMHAAGAEIASIAAAHP